jgi:hypothetical protein
MVVVLVPTEGDTLRLTRSVKARVVVVTLR